MCVLSEHLYHHGQSDFACIPAVRSETIVRMCRDFEAKKYYALSLALGCSTQLVMFRGIRKRQDFHRVCFHLWMQETCDEIRLFYTLWPQGQLLQQTQTLLGVPWVSTTQEQLHSPECCTTFTAYIFIVIFFSFFYKLFYCSERIQCFQSPPVDMIRHPSRSDMSIHVDQHTHTQCRGTIA